MQNNDFKKHLADGETTHKDLLEALGTVCSDFKPLPGNVSRGHGGLDCDEVYPGVIIGDGSTAQNKPYLKMIGVTHILNAAEGKGFGYTRTNESSYTGINMKYLGLQLMDLPSVDISKYFYKAADFIDEAVSAGGKAFVHCVMGMSRSATCVLAYLMIKKGMLAVDAIKEVRSNRNIRPNIGFLQQLATLDNQLRRQRL